MCQKSKLILVLTREKSAANLSKNWEMRQQIISWNDNFVGSVELIIQYANEFHECDICLVVMETRPDTNSISGVLDVTDISLCIVILRHPVSGNN